MTRKAFNPNDYPGYFTKGKDTMIVKLNNVRLAFPHLFTPQVQESGEPKYNASFLLDTSNPACKEIEAALLDVANAKWGANKGKALLDQLKKQGRVCYRSGDDKSQYDGFEGNMYITASNKTRPLVVDRDRSVINAADGKVYPGCFVNTSVEIWAQDNKHGKRINASLRGVQFLRDGDAFAGGAPASPDDFDDLSVEEESVA